MECGNEKCCDLAKMVKKVAEEQNVTEQEVMKAVEKWLANYSKKQ